MLHIMLQILKRVDNQSFRDKWVEDTLHELSTISRPNTLRLLDAGAGQQPYRDIAVKCGFLYFSQDFNSYRPSEEAKGLHISWPHRNHDFICDINEIPSNEKFDVILCTEVLEHVSDPVNTLRNLSRHLTNRGIIVLTAPLLSLIHQAPFHFSSGLTPYWYEKWIPEVGLQILQLSQHGDYADLLSQEIRRFFRAPGIFQKPLSTMIRVFINENLRTAGGFSVFVVAGKSND